MNIQELFTAVKAPHLTERDLKALEVVIKNLRIARSSDTIAALPLNAAVTLDQHINPQYMRGARGQVVSVDYRKGIVTISLNETRRRFTEGSEVKVPAQYVQVA